MTTKSRYNHNLFVQFQRHSKVTEFCSLEVTLDKNVATLEVTMKQPFLFMQVLQATGYIPRHLMMKLHSVITN